MLAKYIDTNKDCGKNPPTSLHVIMKKKSNIKKLFRVMYATTQIVAKLKIPQWSKNLNFTDFQFVFLYSLKKKGEPTLLQTPNFCPKTQLFSYLIHFQVKYFRISSNFGAKIQICLKVKFGQYCIFGQKIIF